MPSRERSYRAPRVAELVADELRRQIISGALPDQVILPKEDELRARFGVSKPSLREALRILETEGLLSVRRGNQGGAVIHSPTAANAAYTLGLVLSARHTDMAQVGRALRELEPLCAALCTERRDRRRTVVPKLRRLHKESLAAIDDRVEVVRLSRSFHETLVAECGNEALIVLVGALEALWSGHERSWAERTDEDFPELHLRQAALHEHGTLVELIDAGDADTVRAVIVAHLLKSQRYPSSSDGAGAIDLAALRALTLGPG